MNSSSNSVNDVCNIAVVGDGSVGKSSIIKAFRTDGFDKVYHQTVGCDFFEKKMSVKGDTVISLRVYDIGGQSLNSKNLKQYLSGASVIFLVYDVTNRESFQNLDDWLNQVRRNSDKSKIYVIGNKVDLISLRQVTEEVQNNFIVSNNLAGGSYFSAKTGENVLRYFYKVSTDALGIKMSEYELGFHDKVLKAYITADTNTGVVETRTSFADEIEAEDLRREAEKKRRENRVCIVS